MRNIISYLKKYTLHITIAYALTGIELASELLFPFFLGVMINNGIIQKDLQNITFWGIFMLSLTLITFGAGIINSFYASYVSTSYAYDVRKTMFEKIQQFTTDILMKHPTSSIVTRFTNDVRQIQNTIFMALRIMTKAPLMVLGGVMMAFIVNAKIAAIFLLTVPVLVIFLLWVLNKGSNMFKKVQQNVDKVNQSIQENIAGIRVIKAFVRKTFEKSRFMKINKQLKNEAQTAFRFVEASMPILLFIMNLSLLFILWYGNIQSVAGTTNVGDVVAIVNYALRIVMAIMMFTFIALAFSRAKASAERVDLILEEKTAPIPENKGKSQIITKGKITFDNVSFTYPESTIVALDKISFTIKPKTTLAVIGATGSGKTTLFQLIPRLYDIKQGNIFIDNIPISQYSTKELRDYIGYVPQSPLLFTGTIKENITFGKEFATDDEMIQAAKTAQIHEAIMQFPKQYHTVVGQRGVNLSGGQKQRISIARALIRQPKILMFDDSTSALDMATEAKLLQALHRYNCTTLMITQKIITAQKADTILLLDEGKILANGSHEELINSSRLYNDIVTSQAEKELPSYG